MIENMGGRFKLGYFPSGRSKKVCWSSSGPWAPLAGLLWSREMNKKSTFRIGQVDDFEQWWHHSSYDARGWERLSKWLRMRFFYSSVHSILRQVVFVSYLTELVICFLFPFLKRWIIRIQGLSVLLNILYYKNIECNRGFAMNQVKNDSAFFWICLSPLLKLFSVLAFQFQCCLGWRRSWYRDALAN